MFLEPLSYDFFRNAILISLLASVCCGIVGTFVVVKRMASISGGVSHAAFGGVGFGYFLGLHPLFGALVFGVGASLTLAYAYLRRPQSLDSLIAVVWSVGMALGVIFITLTPGYAPELSSYLFGNVLLVPNDFVLMVILLDVVALIIVGLAFNYLQAVCFDEEFAKVIGVSTALIVTLLLVLVSVTVVTLIRVVGVILTIALLTTPALTAREWSNNLRQMIVYSSAICGVSAVVGIYGSFILSVHYDLQLPTGPVIILTSTALYVLTLLVRRMQAR